MGQQFYHFNAALVVLFVTFANLESKRNFEENTEKTLKTRVIEKMHWIKEGSDKPETLEESALEDKGSRRSWVPNSIFSVNPP